MCQCKYLVVKQDNETSSLLYKCHINNSKHMSEFLKMKVAFETEFKEHYFLNNGECTFRFVTEELDICPCFEQKKRCEN